MFDFRTNALRRAPRVLTLGLTLALLLTATARAETDWGVGDHYKLATDADGWSIVEPGKTHRKIYLSTSEGSDSNSGFSPDAPVASWNRARNLLREGSSDWVLLKRGDTFGGVRFRDEFRGESPLHPMMVGSYGSGPRPVMNGGLKLWSQGHQNLVIRDLDIRESSEHALDFLGNDMANVLVENVSIKGAESRFQGDGLGEDARNMNRITLRRSSIANVHREQSRTPEQGWFNDPNNIGGFDDAALQSRISGLFANNVGGLLIEESVFDHNGWEDGYSTTDPFGEYQPPNMFSHNLYLSTKNRDLTLRWNINSRGASQGLRDGSGQFNVGNVWLANNIAGYSGEDDGDGNFTTFMDNVVVHPADKFAPAIGGAGWGWSMKDVNGSEAIDNIFAHADVARNSGLHSTAGVLVENYIRYNWGSYGDLNPTGAPFPDPNRTVMAYDAAFGSGQGTIDDFLAAALQQEQGDWQQAYTARALVRYFQEGFGIDRDQRLLPTTVTFTAGGGDQIRWDNRRNWSTDDLPINGDVVNLDGHHVNYAGTRVVDGLLLGDGGVLDVRQGLLAIDAPVGVWAGPSGGTINIDRAGQVLWSQYRYDNPLTVNVDGGRFRNLGVMDGRLTLDARGGEVGLAGGFNGDASRFQVGDGSTLRVIGRDADVGFYGDQGAGKLALTAGATLAFVFNNQGVSPIADLWHAGEIHTTLDLDADGARDATIELDLTNLNLSDGWHNFLLADVDHYRGALGDLQVHGIGQNGITGVRLFLDSIADEIRARVFVNGPNVVEVDFVAPDGDTNFDDVVDVVDLGVLGLNFGRSDEDVDWTMGDFSGDQVVDVVDLGMLGLNFGTEVASDDPAVSVPEPTGLALLTIGLACLGRRRVRRR